MLCLVLNDHGQKGGHVLAEKGGGGTLGKKGDGARTKTSVCFSPPHSIQQSHIHLFEILFFPNLLWHVEEGNLPHNCQIFSRRHKFELSGSGQLHNELSIIRKESPVAILQPYRVLSQNANSCGINRAWALSCGVHSVVEILKRLSGRGRGRGSGMETRPWCI